LICKVRTLAGALILLALGAATAQAQTTVQANWDPNTDNNTAGYRLYYGTAPGAYQWSVDAGNQAYAPVSVSPGNLYYFVVRAYNSSYQEGPSSNEATIDLRAPTGPGAPTAQISATLQGSNTAVVSWQTTNAASASINGTPVGPSGSASVPVDATTTFTLTAVSATGATATASATVTPTPTGGGAGAPTAQISAVLQGNTATVSWQTTNATSISITANGAYYAVGTSGSAGVQVSGPTTFTITARSSDGRTATANASVGGGGTPSGAPTAQISATLQGDGRTAIVAWQTTNATTISITANGAYYAVGPSGSAGVQVGSPTTFTITARSADGQTATATASVGPSGGTTPGDPTAQITATLQGGNYVYVTWQTTNATSISITANGAYYAVGPSGSAGVAVSSPTTFTLTARSADGRTATAVASVGPTSGSGPVAQISANWDGNRVIVSWQTANATTIWINANGTDYAVGPSGSAGISVSAATTFTIYARSADGQMATATASANATAIDRR
jgi:hypothetical protein